MPIVQLPRQGPSGLVIAVVAAVIAIALFIWLDAQRGARALARPPQNQASAFAPPPPLVVPPEPRPVTQLPPVSPPMVRPPPPATPAFVPTPRSAAPPMFPPATEVQSNIVRLAPERPLPRQDEAALVVDSGVQQSSASKTEPASAPSASTAGAAAATNAAADEQPTRATVMGNASTIMPVGTIISAVLETPVDTARSGLVRAIVAQDARGFDGDRVLVPSGSRLIGEFQSEVRSGQNRVLVNWTRLIRPDGVTIRLASPAADALGGAGVPGRVHNFFFQRFAGAVLQSALAVGVNLASRTGSGSVIVEAPGQGLNSVIGQQLQPGNDLKPKITIKQGAAVDVFVAHDLDFSGVRTWRSRREL